MLVGPDNQTRPGGLRVGLFFTLELSRIGIDGYQIEQQETDVTIAIHLCKILGEWVEDPETSVTSETREEARKVCLLIVASALRCVQKHVVLDPETNRVLGARPWYLLQTAESDFDKGTLCSVLCLFSLSSLSLSLSLTLPVCISVYIALHVLFTFLTAMYKLCEETASGKFSCLSKDAFVKKVDSAVQIIIPNYHCTRQNLRSHN